MGAGLDPPWAAVSCAAIHASREPGCNLSSLRIYRIQGRHAGNDVVVDVAMKHPDAGIVGGHVRDFHTGREQFNHICPRSVYNDSVAMPVRGVEIDLGAHAEQVPAHPLTLFHHQAGDIPENVPINRVHQVTFYEFLIVRVHTLRFSGVSLDVFV